MKIESMSKIEKGHFHYNIPHPIAIVGDTHIPICRTDMLFNFLQYAIQCGVTHVLHAGDFVNRNPNLRNTLSIVKRMQERFPLAWHVAWGNHEAGVPLKTIEKCVHELACTQYADEWSGTVFGHNFKMQHHPHSPRSEHVLYISGHTHLSEQQRNSLNPGTFRARKNSDHGFLRKRTPKTNYQMSSCIPTKSTGA
jgi:predicted phosphodiesterase